jgi:hypothetical protein
MSPKVITAETVRNSIFWEVNVAGRSVPTFRNKIILTRARYVMILSILLMEVLICAHIGDPRSITTRSLWCLTSAKWQ